MSIDETRPYPKKKDLETGIQEYRLNVFGYYSV